MKYPSKMIVGILIGIFTYILGLILLLPILLPVFALHEYGHLQEMQKRGIAIEEFSIGIGPIIYQYQGKEFAFSLRAIPLGAYVKSSKEGSKDFNALPVRDRVVIYFAGIRNNILAGISVLIVLQILAYRHGQLSPKELAVTILSTPVKIFFLYIAFVFQCLTLGLVQQGKRFLLSTGGITPQKYVRLFIILNLGIALLNFLPLVPFDGGKIAHDVIVPLIAHYKVVVFLAPFSGYILFFFFWVALTQRFQFLQTD